MLPGTNFGKAQAFTTVGATCVTSANAYIIGVLIDSTATGTFQIWAGVTATSTSAGVPLCGLVGRTTATGLPNYIQFPAYASGGITINIPTTNDPNITLFWNPVGGA